MSTVNLLLSLSLAGSFLMIRHYYRRAIKAEDESRKLRNELTQERYFNSDERRKRREEATKQVHEFMSSRRDLDILVTQEANKSLASETK